MIKVCLKGDVIKEFESGISVFEVARSISEGLARAALAAEVNGEVKELSYPLTEDCQLNILTFDSESGKKTYRHTTSHILAQAVKRLYPSAKLAIGPAIENGFYYDFDYEGTFSPEDLSAIEEEMKKIIKEALPLERFELPREEAIAFMQEKVNHTR